MAPYHVLRFSFQRRAAEISPPALAVSIGPGSSFLSNCNKSSLVPLTAGFSLVVRVGGKERTLYRAGPGRRACWQRRETGAAAATVRVTIPGPRQQRGAAGPVCVGGTPVLKVGREAARWQRYRAWLSIGGQGRRESRACWIWLSRGTYAPAASNPGQPGASGSLPHILCSEEEFFCGSVDTRELVRQ